MKTEMEEIRKELADKLKLTEGREFFIINKSVYLKCRAGNINKAIAFLSFVFTSCFHHSDCYPIDCSVFKEEMLLFKDLAELS